MRWQLSHRADPVAARLADRHYNRQKPGSPQFVPPGACVVLRIPFGNGVWVTSWPFAEYVQHQWAGAWVNTLFRNESGHLASELISEAVAATLAVWPTPPELGIITFVDETKVRPKRNPGYCYLRAGFEVVGRTKSSNLIALQLPPARMPAAEPALGAQYDLFAARSGAEA